MKYVQTYKIDGTVWLQLSREKLFWIYLAVVAILKILFVARNEIVAVPYDSVQYVQLAATNVFSLGAVPGYSLWLAMTQATGVPQRISIELFFLFACLAFALFLKRQFGLRCASFVFTAVIASPATFFLFDLALSDGFYACLNLLALAFSCFLVFSIGFRGKIICAVCLGLTLGVMAITRSEDPILACWFIIVLLIAFVLRRRSGSLGHDPLPLRATVFLGIFGFAASAVPVQAINFIHYKTTGVYARSISAIPGHMTLLSNLARIDPGVRALQFVPISYEARKAAYAVSPSLEKLAFRIEDLEGPYQVASKDSGLPQHEIGAGWIWHVFNHALMQNSQSVDPRVWQAEYRKINAEIEAAFDAGRLKKRFVFHPFLSAPVSDILSRFPGAAKVVFARALGAQPSVDDMGYQRALFDSVLLRRSALVASGGNYSFQGWAFVKARGRTIRSVELASGLGKASAEIAYTKRSDVEAAYADLIGFRPSVIAFTINSDTYTGGQHFVSYVLDDGSVIANRSAVATGANELQSSDGTVLVQGFDYAHVTPRARQGWRHYLQTHLVDISNSRGLVIGFISGLAVMMLFTKLVNKRVKVVSKPYIVPVAMIAILVFLRVAFYSLLEAEAWEVDIRYMVPANVMLIVAAALVVCMFANAARSVFSKNPMVF